MTLSHGNLAKNETFLWYYMESAPIRKDGDCLIFFELFVMLARFVFARVELERTGH